MDAEDMHEFMHEDGHTGRHCAPHYDEVSAMFDALQTVTGANLNAEEGFYNIDGKLFYGEDIDKPVTGQQYEEASEICGLDSDYIKEWCVEYCENQRSWADLEG